MYLKIVLNKDMKCMQQTTTDLQSAFFILILNLH